MLSCIQTVSGVIQINGGQLASAYGSHLIELLAKRGLVDVLFFSPILMAGLGFLDDFFHSD